MYIVQHPAFLLSQEALFRLVLNKMCKRVNDKDKYQGTEFVITCI